VVNCNYHFDWTLAKYKVNPKQNWSMNLLWLKVVIYHIALIFKRCKTTLEEIPQYATNAFAINCHLQLALNNCFCNYFAPLNILATMLQLHLWLMIFSSYALDLVSSMIMPICPINSKWNQASLHHYIINITPSGIHRCIMKLLKSICIFVVLY